MKRLFAGLLLSLVTLCSAQSADPLPVVAVSQIIEHPSLNAVLKGILDYLKEHGLEPNKSMIWIYQNAQGNITTSAQIAQNLVAQTPKPAVFIAIGTPTAQGAIAATRGKDIPVVFAAVTDPKASRLVKDLDHPKNLVTGVMDYPPLDKQIKLMKQTIPTLKKIGLIYNPGESNSVSVIEAFKKLATAEGMEVVEAPVAKTTDITIAVRKLVSEHVDAIYVPQDNTVISAMSQLTTLSYHFKIPVFTSDNGSVKAGALASISYSYYSVGRKTGEYVKRILDGEDVKNLKITAPEKPQLYINTVAAQKLNLTLSANLLKKAITYPEKKDPKKKES